MTEVKSWQDICAANDVQSGLGVRALLGKEQVAIFRLAEKLYAVNAIDPFTNAAVLGRGIVGDLKDQPVVASPIYKQHFNLETGKCLEDESVEIKVYPVREESGKVQLGIV